MKGVLKMNWMWEEKDKSCEDCYHRGYCVKKNDTKQGKYCLSHNTISLLDCNWCKDIK